MDAAAVRRLWSDSMMPDRKIHWSRPLSLVTLGSYLGRRARPTIVLDRAD
jgi:hypothetical protein